MIRWWFASLPGAFAICCATFALGLAAGGPGFAAIAAATAAVLFWGWWSLWLPVRAASTWLSRIPLADPAALTRSWDRAFDRRPAPTARPRLLLWSSPSPVLMVWRLRGTRGILMVSEGWLAARGEDAFRDACRRAVQRLREPALPVETAAAFVIAEGCRLVPPAFLSGLFGPRPLRRNGAPAYRGLGPLDLAAAMVWLFWLNWIQRTTHGGPRSAGALSGPLDTDPRVAVCLNWLGMDAQVAKPAAGAPLEKSILSWIPRRC